MKRIIAVLLAVFAFLSLTGFSTQDPAFERTGQVKNTIDLTKANGEKSSLLPEDMMTMRMTWLHADLPQNG